MEFERRKMRDMYQVSKPSEKNLTTKPMLNNRIRIRKPSKLNQSLPGNTQTLKSSVNIKDITKNLNGNSSGTLMDLEQTQYSEIRATNSSKCQYKSKFRHST